MGSLSLLQWIFLTQELNQGLLHCRQIIYQLSSQGSPGEALFSQHKQDGADCGSDCELLIAKFRLKLKKVGKTLGHSCMT